MVNMIHLHQQALAGANPLYHEFLLGYKKDGKFVYGFVEGRDDPSFYKGKIDERLPEDWQVFLICCGSKNNVLEILNIFDWNRFEQTRILFFVDRDMDDLTSHGNPVKNNLYVTPCYSIENSVVNGYTVRRVLQEIYGIISVPQTYLDFLEGQFEKSKKDFCEMSVPIMAQLLLWRREGTPYTADACKLSNLFVWERFSLKRKNETIEYSDDLRIMWAEAGLSTHPPEDIKCTAYEIIRTTETECVCRGKYLVWLLVGFCHHVKSEFHNVFPEYETPIKERFSFGQRNAMTAIAPRSRCPSSLSQFIESQYLSYISEIESR